MGHRAGVTQAKLEANEGRWPGSEHEARRLILDLLPGSNAIETLPSDADRYGYSDDAPTIAAVDLIEPAPFRAIRVADPRGPRVPSGFTAFLDGIQNHRLVNQDKGISIIWGTVAAAIRVRVNRKLISWTASPPVVRSSYYFPFRYLPDLAAKFKDNPRVVDTAEANEAGNFPSKHPAALIEAAVRRVQQDREKVETQLAESWCADDRGALYMDGSITSSAVTSGSTNAIGIIKTHRRLYADGKAFDVINTLQPCERTSVFRVTSKSRYPVASWYLRVRGAPRRDAFFGLVRVEAALGDDISARADEISRWVIAEGAPLSLPDGRWDKMAYGIRDTEEFLRAIS